MNDEDLKKLKLIAIAKEKKRRETQVQGEEVRSNIAQRAGEFFTPPKPEHLAIAAAQGATMGFADEIGGAIGGPDVRDDIRARTKEAREQSPVTTFITEQAASLPAGGVLGKVGGKIARTLGEGGLLKTGVESAITSIGESESEEGADQTIEGGFGATIGMGTQMLGKVLKMPFKKHKEIRARTLGAGKREFLHKGKYRDPEDTVDELKGMGFLDNKNAVEFDINKGKYVKSRKGTVVDKNRVLESYEERIAQTQGKISNHVEDLIKNNASKNKYYGGDLANYQPMLEDMDEMIGDSIDRDKMIQTFQRELTILEKNINDIPEIVDELGEVVAGPAQGVDLVRLNKIKQNYQRAASKLYENPKDDGDIVKGDVYKLIARNLRQFIEDNTGAAGEEIANLNRVNSMHLNIGDNIRKARAAQQASGFKGSAPLGVNLMYLGGRAASAVGGSTEGALTRANVGETGSRIPFRPQIEDMVKTAPVREYTRMMNTPDSAVIPYALDNLMGNEQQQRKPQSLPEQLVRTKFPRTSESIMQKKDLLLAKIAQQAPDMFDIVNEVLDNRPEDIPDIMPMLIQIAPTLFEKDKYNRFDGIINDPKMKDMARKDTMKNDSLSNSDKIEILNRLNKTGEFPL